MSKTAEELKNDEHYQKIIDYLPHAVDEHLKRVALETAKSNPKFFIKALNTIGINIEDYDPEHRPARTVAIMGSVTVVHDGVTYNFPEKDWGEVVGYLPDKKVNAIKQIRNTTGTGLKEAKQMCDYLCGNYSHDDLKYDKHFTTQSF